MGGIARQFLQPGEAIGFGIECGLEATDGRGAVLQTSRAQRTPSASNCSNGTTALTSPISNASLAP